jgi:hypothetical protein
VSTRVCRTGRRELGESTGVLGEGPREHQSSRGGTEAATRPRTLPRAPDAHGTKSIGGAMEAAKHGERERKPPPSTERNAAARDREPDLGAAAQRGEDAGVRER